MEKRTLHEKLNHYLCPLHVYCRMREYHVWKPTAIVLCKIYEWGLYKPFILKKEIVAKGGEQ